MKSYNCWLTIAMATGSISIGNLWMMFGLPMCALDYTMAASGGACEFVRQYTLASGGPFCDCGYRKLRG